MDLEGFLHQQPFAVVVVAFELDLKSLAEDAQGVVVGVEGAVDDGSDHPFWIVVEQRVFEHAFAGAGFLQDRYNSRFRWSVVGQASDAGPDVWRVRFEEFVRPTLLRGSNSRDAPATGEVWIEADTGRVLRTELRLVVGASLSGTSGMAMRSTVEIDTRFAVDADLGIALPVEMTEAYLLGGSSIRTEATYGRFRQFGVSTEETLTLPDLP
jgi:hypothetical protein